MLNLNLAIKIHIMLILADKYIKSINLCYIYKNISEIFFHIFANIV